MPMMSISRRSLPQPKVALLFEALTHGTGCGPVFAIAGSLHVLAFRLILVMVRKVQSVTMAP